ncbi:MAG TPA: type II toxin-antitoxin system HicB family antitoxin [Prolixibacteraceae bacterium]|nr:type II toxin-antitoxin system HicB family antitoxin [Prolixibacteraceae bacterium]
MKEIIVEVANINGYYSAHLPELPGCVTTGRSLKEIEYNIKEIVPFHLEGQRDSGGKIPDVFNEAYSFVFKRL